MLDPQNQAVYKQLYRAAKAKTKLRIKVTVTDSEDSTPSQPLEVTNASEVTLAPTVLSLRALPDAPKELSTADFGKSAETLVQPERTPTAETPNAREKPAIQSHSNEAPLPKPFALRDQFYEDLANAAKLRTTALRAKDQSFQVPLTTFSVQCNYCGTNIPGAHWHCNGCDGGDFDLCLPCVEEGIHCDDDQHYLIKRTIEDGKVKYSTSTIFDKKTPKPEAKLGEVKKEMPGTFNGDSKEEPTNEHTLTRTCNCCVNGKSRGPFESDLCGHAHDI